MSTGGLNQRDVSPCISMALLISLQCQDYLGKRNMQDCGQEGRGRRGDCEQAPVVGNLAELQSPVGPRREHLLPRRQGSSFLSGRRSLPDVPLLFLQDFTSFK